MCGEVDLLHVRRRPGGDLTPRLQVPEPHEAVLVAERHPVPRRGNGTRSEQVDLDPRVLDSLHPKDTRKVDAGATSCWADPAEALSISVRAETFQSGPLVED